MYTKIINRFRITSSINVGYMLVDGNKQKTKDSSTFQGTSGSIADVKECSIVWIFKAVGNRFKINVT